MSSLRRSRYQAPSKPTVHGGLRLYGPEPCLDSHWLRLVMGEKEIDGARWEGYRSGRPPEDLLSLGADPSQPTLVERSAVLQNASVIAEYIDERFPHPALLPADPIQRAQARMALIQLRKELFPLVNRTGGHADLNQLVEVLARMGRLFPARGWFLGFDYSIVDCAWAALLWSFDQQRTPWPDKLRPIKDYAQRSFARPAFQKSLSPTT